jgi:hypothetical protein
MQRPIGEPRGEPDQRRTGGNPNHAQQREAWLPKEDDQQRQDRLQCRNDRLAQGLSNAQLQNEHIVAQKLQ